LIGDIARPTRGRALAGGDLENNTFMSGEQKECQRRTVVDGLDDGIKFALIKQALRGE
jgi:hypothetical protein